MRSQLAGCAQQDLAHTFVGVARRGGRHRM